MKYQQAKDLAGGDCKRLFGMHRPTCNEMVFVMQHADQAETRTLQQTESGRLGAGHLAKRRGSPAPTFTSPQTGKYPHQQSAALCQR